MRHDCAGSPFVASPYNVFWRNVTAITVPSPQSLRIMQPRSDIRIIDADMLRRHYIPSALAFPVAHITDHFGGDTGNNRIIRHIPGNHGPGSDQRIHTNA